MFLYSAVSSPLDRSKRFKLHPQQTGTNSASLGSILHTQQLRVKTIHSYFISPLSIARYSFIQLSEENKNAQTSKGGFEPVLSQLRVRLSTAELLRSTQTSVERDSSAVEQRTDLKQVHFLFEYKQILKIS